MFICSSQERKRKTIFTWMREREREKQMKLDDDNDSHERKRESQKGKNVKHVRREFQIQIIPNGLIDWTINRSFSVIPLVYFWVTLSIDPEVIRDRMDDKEKEWINFWREDEWWKCYSFPFPVEWIWTVYTPLFDARLSVWDFQMPRRGLKFTFDDMNDTINTALF